MNESINSWNATISPNPASSEVFIKSTKESEEIKMTINDVDGRVLYTTSFKTSAFKCNIKLSLNDGVYFVTLGNSSGEKVVKKLIISK